MRSQKIAQIIEKKVVAVIRTNTEEQAIKAALACIKGGIEVIEITYTTKNASKIIKELKEKTKSFIGAGTVMDVATTVEAINNGADFIVSPYFNKEIAKICNINQVAYLPGCMSLNEMIEATSYGSEIVKLFPGSNFTPDIIKALKAPVPQLNIMPTGGVNLENIQEWFKNGAVLVGIGGNLIAPALENDFESVEKLAAEYMAKVNG